MLCLRRWSYTGPTGRVRGGFLVQQNVTLPVYGLSFQYNQTGFIPRSHSPKNSPQVLSSTMPRAPKRTAKCSTLLRRRSEDVAGWRGKPCCGANLPFARPQFQVSLFCRFLPFVWHRLQVSPFCRFFPLCGTSSRYPHFVGSSPLRGPGSR